MPVVSIRCAMCVVLSLPQAIRSIVITGVMQTCILHTLLGASCYVIDAWATPCVHRDRVQLHMLDCRALALLRGCCDLLEYGSVCI